MSNSIERLLHSLEMPSHVSVGSVKVPSRPLLRAAVKHLASQGKIENLETDVDIARAARLVKESYPELVSGEARAERSGPTLNVGGTPPKPGLSVPLPRGEDDWMRLELERTGRLHELDAIPDDSPGPVAAKMAHDDSKPLTSRHEMQLDSAVAHDKAMQARYEAQDKRMAERAIARATIESEAAAKGAGHE